MIDLYLWQLHFVNFNTKYSNIGEAVKQEDGLAVLGVIFKVCVIFHKL